MKFELYNLENDELHGTFDTLDEARGAVRFDRLTAYEIQKTDDAGNFLCGVVKCDPADDFDPENIYNIPSIAQSIAEDRQRRRP